MLSVYDSDLTVRYKIPVSDARVCPAPLQLDEAHSVNHKRNRSRCFLCNIPGCPGKSCGKVHILNESARGSWDAQKVHANFAVPDVSQALYPTLPPGRLLIVESPNLRKPHFEIPSDMVYVTKGVLGALNHKDAHRLQHCAHYAFNQVCDFGPNCQYVHAVTVVPGATKGSLAPKLMVRRDSGGPGSRHTDDSLNYSYASGPLERSVSNESLSNRSSEAERTNVKVFRHNPYAVVGSPPNFPLAYSPHAV
jgi:hypothetical protein